MKYEYDLWGWFNGAASEESTRVVDEPPSSIPAQRVVGQPFPNWTGYAWVMLLYAEPVEEEIPEPEEDPRLWWLDVGPFYDRFGMDAVAIASSDHGACKAVQTLTGVRKYIDLKDARVSAMIDMLIATNQPTAVAYAPGSGPMTLAKKTAILTTPTTDAERHIKGL